MHCTLLVGGFQFMFHCLSCCSLSFHHTLGFGHRHTTLSSRKNTVVISLWFWSQSWPESKDLSFHGIHVAFSPTDSCVFIYCCLFFHSSETRHHLFVTEEKFLSHSHTTFKYQTKALHPILWGSLHQTCHLLLSYNARRVHHTTDISIVKSVAPDTFLLTN